MQKADDLSFPAQRMTRAEAAAYLGLRPSSLATWATTKRHKIPYFRVGHVVYYRRRDLDRWVESRIVNALPAVEG